MAKKKRDRLMIGIVAASIGLAAGTTVGVLVSQLGNWTEGIPVHATATHGRDNYILATGELEQDVEYVAFLDALTADLKVAVMNVRNYSFQIFYARNIKNDFKDTPEKNPRYLMATGLTAFNSQTGRRYGQSVIYVTEINSGQCIAYALQDYQNRKSANQKIQGNLIPMDQVEFRQVSIRPGTTVGQASDKKEAIKSR
ncbi:MAG: hypothetical protein N2C12_18445 [Planctomycetales bacterium]